MGAPIMRYHEHKQRWMDYEEDAKEFWSNKEKYAGIGTKPENFSFFYRSGGKQVKSMRRLKDLYEFKLDFEANNEVR